MAIRTYLSGNDTLTVSDNNTVIIGESGANTQTIKIASGVTGVTTDSNIDRIDVSGNLSTYKFVASAAGTQIQDAAGNVMVTIPSLNGTTAAPGQAVVAFADGSANLVQSATGYTLGGSAVPTTAAAITSTAMGTSFNTGVKSAVATATTTVPTLGFASTSTAVSTTEGNSGTSNATFTASLSSASALAVTVNYATASGTAISGSDFTPTSGTLTFASGETSKTITVPVIGDAVFETNETYTLTLSQASAGATLGSALTATGTITNDDTNAAPTITSDLTTATAQVGQQNSLGINYTVADTDTGILTATISAGNGQVRLTDAGNTLTFGTGTSQGIFYNSLVVSGTISNLNSILDTIAYQTASTSAGTDSVNISISDGTTAATRAVSLNIGSSFTLTSGNDTMTGGVGSDLFTGTYANYAATDILNGGDGIDTLTLTTVTNALPTATTANVTNVEILNLTTVNANDNVVVTVDGNRITGLTNINTTLDDADASTLGAHTYQNLANNAVVKIINGEAAGTPTATTNGVALAREGATNIGQADTLGFTLEANGGAGAITIDALTANGIDTLNLVSTQTSGSAAATAVNTITALLNTVTNSKVVATGAVALTLTTLDADTAGFQVFDGSGMTAALSINGTTPATHTITTGLSLTGGSAADNLTGSNKVDVIVGGAGDDTLIGGIGADTLTGGTGFDQFRFTASVASAADYANVVLISDFTVAASAAGSDKFAISEGNTFMVGAATGLSTGGGAAGTLAASAAGAAGTVVQTVAQNATSAAIGITTDFIKLTTGVAAAGTNQLTFDAAIGTSLVTGVLTATSYAGSFYDTTNSKAVIFEVLTTAGTATQIEAADVIRVIGTISMSATDYTTFGANQLEFY